MTIDPKNEEAKGFAMLGTILVFVVLAPYIGTLGFHDPDPMHIFKENEVGLVYLIGGPFAALAGAICGIYGLAKGALPIWVSLSAGVATALLSFLVIGFFLGFDDTASLLPKYVLAYAIASTVCGGLSMLLWRNKKK